MNPFEWNVRISNWVYCDLTSNVLPQDKRLSAFVRRKAKWIFIHNYGVGMAGVNDTTRLDVSCDVC